MNTVEECSFRMGWPILNDRFYIGLELYSGSYLFFQRYLLRSVVIIFLLSGRNFPTCFGRFSEYKDVNKNYFQINQHVLNIQNKTTHLLINEAIKDISERKIKEPNNKIYDYLESYTWFFTLFILEQEDQYVKALSKKKETAPKHSKRRQKFTLLPFLSGRNLSLIHIFGCWYERYCRS